MKRIFRTFGIIALAAIIGFGMTACDGGANGGGNGENNGDDLIRGIVVRTNPTKMEYLVSETFNPAGMVITVTPLYGPTFDIPLGFQVRNTPFDIAGQIPVTISYLGKSTILYVTVHPTVFVTFDRNNGSEPTTQPVRQGFPVASPANPTRPNFTGPITIQGLYQGETTGGSIIVNQPYIFSGWFTQNDVRWDFDNAVITDTIFTARYSGGSNPIDVSAETGNNDVERAINFMRRVPRHYILAVGEDEVYISPQNLFLATPANYNIGLGIIGLERERKLKLKSPDNIWNATIFNVEGEVNRRVTLTLGNNITLVGLPTNVVPLVRVSGLNSNFFMLDGSKVIGNTNTWDGFDSAGAVLVRNNGSFTMRGGTITGNFNTSTHFTRAGGVFVDCLSNAHFNMEGGTIIGNTRPDNDFDADVYLFRGSVFNSDRAVTLSGTAQIGKLTLSSREPALNVRFFPTLRIASGWAGNISYLNLSHGHSGTVDGTIERWINQSVLTATPGHTLNSDDVNRIISLGFFFIESVNTFAQRPISNTHKIANSGVDIGRLVLR